MDIREPEVRADDILRLEDDHFNNGNVCIVSGCATGIGRACALGMARAGADVAIIDVNGDMGRDTTREILDLGRKSIFVACDVTDLNQVQSMVRQVVEEFDRLDIAFNNAGIIVGSTKPTIGEESIDCWHKTMNLDLTAVFYCCREEAKYMIPQKYGKIINTASMSATIANNFPNFGAGFVAIDPEEAVVENGLYELISEAESGFFADGINALSGFLVQHPEAVEKKKVQGGKLFSNGRTILLGIMILTFILATVLFLLFSF